MELYEITDQYKKAFDQLSDQGIDQQTIEDSLLLIKDDINQI